ncbi:succinyl-diaminopimelate desuccinylase [Acidocella sp.]|uniref:succinyl-diaminopimelate desuccinylase n=1 Tax=Acidocella sp. TaxID=50710 RepID=UPI00261715BA|nr:succinyl-diaminopimelate desuccinylase [Acidocella sp.]
MIEATALLRDLLRCPSVNPADEGAQRVLISALEGLGFEVTKLRFGEVENFFAERKGPGRHLCFAGHTDVVPPGDGWSHGPFAAEEEDGVIYGRGAVDMKGGIAAFVAAAAGVRGHVSLLITGDEEGEAVDGTVRVLEWMHEAGKIPDFCVVGEPTCKARLGDVVKVGRRGSLNASIIMPGRQGHAAYPYLADNAVHKLIPVLAELVAGQLDNGSEFFEPSTLQITSVDVGNVATNVIPGEAVAKLNIRFNDLHSGASLTAWLKDVLLRHAADATLSVKISGEAFLTQPGDEVDTLARAIETVTGYEPKRDTGGGTSDARFIARYCPVAEFGLVGTTMHKVDEAVPVAELEQLAQIYVALMHEFCR